MRAREGGGGEGEGETSCNARGCNISKALESRRNIAVTREGKDGEGRGGHYRWLIKTSTTQAIRSNTTLRSVFGFTVANDKVTRGH